MSTMKAQDYFTIRLASILSDLDHTFLTFFYTPFIGADASSLWQLLHRLKHLFELSGLQPIESILTHLNWNPTQLQLARQHLEAVGLMKTYAVQPVQTHHFVFELYAPKTPKAFFDDPLLLGMLKKVMPSQYILKLEALYATELADEEDDISANFADVFHPDFDDPIFAISKQTSLLGKQSIASKRIFDAISFAQHLQAIDIDVKWIKPSEMNHLADLALLYGLDEHGLSLLIPEVLNLQEGTIDFSRLSHLASMNNRLQLNRKKKPKVMHETSMDAQEVNQMEQLSCLDFLRLKQHGGDPSPADVRLIEDLHFSQHLSMPAINALVHYVLKVQDNTLPRAYTQKLAASLAREKLEHAIDVLDYFAKTTSKEPKKRSSTTPSPSPVVDESHEDALEAALKQLK